MPTVKTTAADIPCKVRPMMRTAMLRPRHNISVAPASASRPQRRGVRRDSERSANQPHIADQGQKQTVRDKDQGGGGGGVCVGGKQKRGRADSKLR